MSRVTADLVAFAKQYLRTKVGAFFVFVFPILLILLFGAVFANTGSSAIGLPVQDLDGTPLSRAFLSALNNTTVVRVSMIPTDVDLETHVRENSLSVALRIPTGFQDEVLQSLATNGSVRVNVTLFGDTTQSSFGVAVGVVGAVSDQMSFALAGARPLIGVQAASVGSAQYTAIDFFLPGIIGLTVMTNALYFMTSMCAEYRTRRYFKLLATTTLTKAEWLTSKILWFSISLILSLLVTVAVGIAVWSVRVTIDAFAVAFVVAGAFLFTSMGMVLGSIVKDPESGSAVSNAIGFPMMFLSGSFWPLEAMPSYLQTVATALPLTYLNDGLRDVMVFGNLDAGLVNLGIVATVGAVLFVAGSRLMSWKGR
jgi:ABC-2 type transport system permease protein